VGSTDALFSVTAVGVPPEQPSAEAMRSRITAPFPILLYKLAPMGHLDSQRSLPTIGTGKLGFSSTAKKLRLAAGQKVAILNAPEGYSAQLSPGPADIGTQLQPATPWWMKQDVLGELTSVTRYEPVAFVAIDDNYTALRFKRA